MTQEELVQLNEFVLRMPKSQRKRLWDFLNNSGIKQNSPINGLALRRSLRETERRGLRWMGLKKEVV